MVFFRRFFYCSSNIFFYPASRLVGWVQRWNVQPTAVNWWAEGLSQVDECSGSGSAGHTASNIPLHCSRLLWDGWPSPGVEWKPSPANDHRRKRASVFFRLKIAFQPVLEVVGDHWTQFYGCIAYEATDLPLAVCFRIKSVVNHLNLNRLFMKIVANPFWSALDLRGKIWIIMLS